MLFPQSLGAIDEELDAALPEAAQVSRLQMRSNTALVATPTWSYRRNGGTVLRLCDASAPCLLDLTGTIGARVIGLSLDGAKLGTQAVGVFLDGDGHKEEETLVIDNVRVAHFTGDAINLRNVWAYTVRNSMMAFCGGNGLTTTRWDGYLYGNIISVFISQDTLKVSNHGYKILQCMQSAGFKAKFSSPANHFKHGYLLFIGGNHTFFNSGFSNAPGRIVDDSFQRLFITGIYRKAQVSQ